MYWSVNLALAVIKMNEKNILSPQSTNSLDVEIGKQMVDFWPCSKHSERGINTKGRLG